jgi:hypothetical protein
VKIVINIKKQDQDKKHIDLVRAALKQRGIAGPVSATHYQIVSSKLLKQKAKDGVMMEFDVDMRLFPQENSENVN